MAKKTKVQGGSLAIRAIVEDGLDEIQAAATPVNDPNPSLARNGVKPGQWEGAPWDRMPPDCPFEVLGQAGDVIYIRSATYHLMEVKAIDLQAIMRMCAPYPNYALWAWPGFGTIKDPETGDESVKVKRLERDKAATCIISEAARRGTFDVQQSVRGRGGWRAGEEFIWHSGEKLWSVDYRVGKNNKAEDFKLVSRPPIQHDGKLYAKAAETLAPWRKPIGIDDTPAQKILQHLTTWQWERPWLDPLIMLGFIGVGFLGGALRKRPIVGLTGGRGRGKSTLIDYVETIFGPLIYSTKNTTAAGIYQNMGQDSRPVLIDEFEAKAGSYKEQGIIELARHSYDGSKLYRGSSDHDGVQFQMYSAFLLSAINLPPLSQQDRSRMAILHLNPLQATGPEPVIQEEWGRMLLRQLMDGWHELQHHLLPAWATLLHEAGYDARAIDTYGTLLAVAELLVGKFGMADIGFEAGDRQWTIEALRAATAVELEEQVEKWQDVMGQLLSTSIDQWKAGERHTVGKILELYEHQAMSIEEARASLAVVGLGLRPSGDPSKGYCLAVPHSSPQLTKIFEHTDYFGGGWSNVLKQAPADVVLRDLAQRYKTLKINRQDKKCLLVDMLAYDRATAPAEE